MLNELFIHLFSGIYFINFPLLLLLVGVLFVSESYIELMGPGSSSYRIIYSKLRGKLTHAPVNNDTFATISVV